MILVRDLIQAILYDLNETYNRKHSDEEFIHLINTVLRHINVTLMNAESFYILKEGKLKVRNDMAKLPDDFGKFHAFIDYDDDYKFMNHYVRLKEDTTMSYFFLIEEVEEVDDEIDLPYFFFDLIQRFVAGMISGLYTQDILGQMVNQEVTKLTQSESAGPIDRPMPFYV